MHLLRLVRHAAAMHWRTRLQFSSATLDAIERAIAAAERMHAGEIRFAIETALPPLHIVNGVTPRERALEVFANLRVWDTEHNNGVLIYLLLADRAVEIIADRGFTTLVSAAEWQAVCRLMEEHFRAGRFEAGSIAGVNAVGSLMTRHFPPAQAGAPAAAPAPNELPDRPALL